MWFKSITFSELLLVFLLFYYNVVPTSATNMAQSKNQQQTLEQTSTTSTQYQQHTNQMTSQTQHKLQQQQQEQQQQEQQQQNQLQLQQHSFQSAGIAAHPANDISSNTNSVVHVSSTGHLNAQALPSSALSSSSSSTSTLAQLPSAEYVIHDKEMAMQEILKRFNTDTDLNDPYQMSNDLKRSAYDNTNFELPPPPPLISTLPNNMAFPWNLYDRSYAPTTLPPPQIAGRFFHHFNPFEHSPSSFPVMPRFLPYMSYPQPVYVPYPFVMSPEMYYPGYSSLPRFSNDYEDSMSRRAGTSNRPASSQHLSRHVQNSRIYYVRLPPTPYMFLPSLGLGTTAPTMPGYQNILPYQSLSSFPSFPSFSPIFNVPINFLANGKPSNIYQMSAPPNEIQNHVQFPNIPSSFNTRFPPPAPANSYRPDASSPNYFNTQHPSASPSSSNYGSYPGSSSVSAVVTPTTTTSSSSSLSHQDSKLTVLKRPYFFNGRPDDIYILPNNFNHLYSSEGSYEYY